jgi:mannosyl-oligosaccharide alpha-1,2-mannosidase
LTSAELEHLTCFAGGMSAIAGKVFNRPEDVAEGGRLADGCVGAYRNILTGIMHETFTAARCPSKTNCKWDTKKWYDAIDDRVDEATMRERIDREKLSPGFTHVHDARYLLRYCLFAFYS